MVQTSLVTRWLRRFSGGRSTLATALESSDALIAPSRRQQESAFIDLRARLASRPDDVVRRTLNLILLRARATKSDRSLAILRSLPQLAPRRYLGAEISFKTSRNDPGFLDPAREGNAARDAGNWEKGAAAYAKALQLYPLHHGYRVQYGHCLKETQRFHEAEISYRNALALGAPIIDVWPHLEHSVRSVGGGMRIYPPEVIEQLERDEARQSDAFTTSQDLELLGRLFLGEERFDMGWTIRMLRIAPRRSQIVEQLMKDPAFSRANRRLLAMAGRGVI